MASWLMVPLPWPPGCSHSSWPQGQRSQCPGLGPAAHSHPVLWAHLPMALRTQTRGPPFPLTPWPTPGSTFRGCLSPRRGDPIPPRCEPPPSTSNWLPCFAVLAQPQASLSWPEATRPFLSPGLCWMLASHSHPGPLAPQLSSNLEEYARRTPTPGPWHYWCPAQPPFPQTSKLRITSQAHFYPNVTFSGVFPSHPVQTALTSPRMPDAFSAAPI